MTTAVTSSSTLWAQASKEWVIPAKPKPGRKPKKDPPQVVVEGTPEPDSKGRRVQNRAAQRAFRERKQSQLADLQARVQSYEQGEIERNVALQNIAKRLKEENDMLRKENAALREELRKLRPETSPETERKRWREDSLQPYSAADLASRKRMRTDQSSQVTQDTLSSSAMSLVPSPSSLVSSPADSPASSGQNDTFSPMSFGPRSPNPPMYSHTQQPAMASLFSGFGSGKGMNDNRTSFDHPFGMVDCGFCSDETTCMCRELALQQVGPRIAVHDDMPGTTPSIPTNTTSAHSPPEVKMESRGSISISSTPQITPQMAPATVPMQSMSLNNGSSILDNLPAYAPPVPLPRRRAPDMAPSAPIFPVYPVQSVRSTRSTSANCTGDPSNCLACADDPFGKAFCAALGSSVKQCANCSNNGSTSNSGFGCGGCGNPSMAGSSTGATSPSSRAGSISAASSPGHVSSSSDTVPCNAAWAQLKSHPNIAFADLSMLAEVVARRSKCSGPVLANDSELETLAGRQSDGQRSRGADDMPVLLTDPHAQYHERASSQGGSPLQHGISLQCGRQRVVEVQAEGVRDALALLDGQFQRS